MLAGDDSNVYLSDSRMKDVSLFFWGLNGLRVRGMKLFDKYSVALADEETVSLYDLRKPELRSYIVHQSEGLVESSGDERSEEIIDFHFNKDLCGARTKMNERIK